MNRQALKVSALMRTLAHPKRLILLCQLTAVERSVGELAALVDMREAAVSQQLALLRREGLVRTRRQGQTVWYTLSRSDVAKLLQFLYDTYCGDTAARA